MRPTIYIGVLYLIAIFRFEIDSAIRHGYQRKRSASKEERNNWSRKRQARYSLVAEQNKSVRIRTEILLVL